MSAGAGIPSPSASPSPGLRLALAFAAVYVIWGSTYLAIRFAIETLPPFLMAGARFLTAGSILYLLARSSGAPAPRRVHWGSAAFVGGFLLLGGNGAVVFAQQYVPSGLAALLVATEPLWVVVILWLGRDRIRPTKGIVLGLALGFTGVAMLVGPGAVPSASEPVHPLGALLVVGAALSWAYGSVRGRDLAAPSSPRQLAGMQMLCGGALLTLVGIASGELSKFDPSGISLRSLAAFGYLVVFGSIVAFSAYGFLLRNAPPARVATYAFVNPAVAVFLGWALAGEELGPRTLGAAAIILAGVVVIVTRRSSGSESESPGPGSRGPGSPDSGSEADAVLERTRDSINPRPRAPRGTEASREAWGRSWRSPGPADRCGPRTSGT